MEVPFVPDTFVRPGPLNGVALASTEQFDYNHVMSTVKLRVEIKKAVDRLAPERFSRENQR